ncbi:hypothetical protein ACFE04_019324 [Oxalis oulophora]
MNSAEQMPANFEILVVDGDSVSCLANAQMLGALGYRVFTAKQGTDALCILVDRIHDINLILVDAIVADMHINNFLGSVGQISNSPVVVLVDENNQHDILRQHFKVAVFCLMTPFNLDDAKNLWQCVTLAKMVNGTMILLKEREPLVCSNSTRHQPVEGGSLQPKKRIMVWTDELHGKFLNALEVLGMNAAVPMKILECMKVPGLKREQIASHLQKYRLREREKTATSGGLLLSKLNHNLPGGGVIPETNPTATFDSEQSSNRTSNQQLYLNKGKGPMEPAGDSNNVLGTTHNDQSYVTNPFAATPGNSGGINLSKADYLQFPSTNEQLGTNNLEFESVAQIASPQPPTTEAPLHIVVSDNGKQDNDEGPATEKSSTNFSETPTI